MTALEPINLASEWNPTAAAVVPRIPSLTLETLELRRRCVKALGDNVNHLGSMSAGTLFGMAEMLGGALSWPKCEVSAYLPTVKDLTIDHRHPARSDVIAVAAVETSPLGRIVREAAERSKTRYQVYAALTDEAHDPPG